MQKSKIQAFSRTIKITHLNSSTFKVLKALMNPVRRLWEPRLQSSISFFLGGGGSGDCLVMCVLVLTGLCILRLWVIASYSKLITFEQYPLKIVTGPKNKLTQPTLVQLTTVIAERSLYYNTFYYKYSFFSSIFLFFLLWILIKTKWSLS